MHEQMKAFNKFVLDLRQEKYEILRQCRDIEKELKAVQRNLPPDLQKPIPPIYDMEPCEEPEREFEITKEDIDARINKKIEELGLTPRHERVSFLFIAFHLLSSAGPVLQGRKSYFSSSKKR